MMKGREIQNGYKDKSRVFTGLVKMKLENINFVGRIIVTVSTCIALERVL